MPGQVKAILPPKFNERAVLDVLHKEMDKYAPFLVKDFERTTSRWGGAKPKFSPHLVTRADAIAIEIHVVGSEKGRNKWHWVNEGTRPHKIRAKNARYLHFQTGSKASSRPGTTHTVRASKGSGGWVRKKEVRHPGTEARDWSGLIAKDHQRPFQQWMEAAMKAAAKASGHGEK